EQRGIFTLDCCEAGLTEHESMEQVRHLVHQWKTPFRAPYSGGSSFQQLIQLRRALERTLDAARSRPAASAPKAPAEGPVAAPSQATPAVAAPAPPVEQTQAPTEHTVAEEEDFLQRCVSDIKQQLAGVPPKHTPGVSTINLGGCKLMIATWEAEAFRSQL